MKGDRRSTIRKRLDPLYLPHYDRLCDALSEEWQPYCGFRSLDQQAALYARGRELPGKVVTYARPGMSAHNYGCASDWTIFNRNDQPVWLLKSDPRWREYEKACAKAGVLWGGYFSRFTDYFHNELGIKISWRLVKEVYDDKGADDAYTFIKQNLEGV